MAALLDVRELSVSYGKVEAVHKVSLTVTEGTIVSVIGPNGAGKTTLLAAIMGTLAANGDIRYQGEAIGSLSVEQRVGGGLVLVPEKRDLFASMTVSDNLELGAFARARRGDRDIARTLDDVYARFPRLQERRGAAGGHAFRRRAADAGAGPRADEQAETADARRAVARALRRWSCARYSTSFPR